MQNLWNWLKAVAVGFAVEVYHYLRSKLNKKNLEIRDMKLQNELKENEKTEEKTRTDDDAHRAIQSAIDRGRKL